jgi:hypothetical protein
MELREFISKSLLDIHGALSDVDAVAPGTVIRSFTNTTPAFVGLGVTNIQCVDFEVLVRADEHAGSEAKLSVVAAFVGGAVKGDSGTKSGHSATLRFKVPIDLSAVFYQRKNA